MNIVEIIEKKKNGRELSKEEIQYWVRGCTEGSIETYQISALLMAICFRGMTERETVDLTEAMMNSGDVVDLSDVENYTKTVTVDKHSTGGVGDKVSLVLCPMLACSGVAVAKMSGRGLGFTGGTLDKLESIPHTTVNLTIDEFKGQIERKGIAIIGQTSSLVPADKKLYALRDVTGTVGSEPLIASSIMSKKLAGGCSCILLDVKYGSGAFMHTKEDAEHLAKLMIRIGHHFGRNVQAEITSMEQPLGMAIGNVLEVKEAIAVLTGNGPKDVLDICLSSGATLLLQAGVCKDRDEAMERLRETIDNRSAFKCFCNLIKNQQGDESYLTDPTKFPTAMYKIQIKSNRSGYLSGMQTADIGRLSAELGAGRIKMTDPIDIAAGIVLNKKIGDKVNKNELLMTMYTERPYMDSLTASALNDFSFSDEPVKAPSLIEERIRWNPDADASGEEEFIIEPGD